ncbi:MAG TPA: HEAT repeat domain-containing protein [Verrucomicrobiales bacterium]|nr:HEAT repeat domain-containing protein [Verrucomicrobiales bacterium]HIL68878.1 HEAT repeat domain-containing protein [Verrucomicrobiota bacterium]
MLRFAGQQNPPKPPSSRAGLPLGPDALPLLVKGLQHTNPVYRAVCADSVRELSEEGFDATESIPVLAGALDDSDAFVRMYAAKALGSMGPSAELAVPRLIRLLNVNDEVTRYPGLPAPVRSVTAEALGKIGLSASDAVSDLSRMATHPGLNLSVPAEIALFRIRGAEGDSVSRLVKKWRAIRGIQQFDRYRVQIVQIFGEIGPAAEPARQIIMESLNSHDESLRRVAEQALKLIDQEKEFILLEGRN